MGGWGGRNTQLDRQPHNVHTYVTLLPLFQLGQEPAGELEEWKGKVNNTDSAWTWFYAVTVGVNDLNRWLSTTAHLSEERWSIRTPNPSVVYVWFHLSHSVLLSLWRRPAHETCEISMFWLNLEQVWVAVGIVPTRNRYFGFQFKKKFPHFCADLITDTL